MGYPTLLSATFALLIEAGYTADECGYLETGEPIKADHPAAATGYAYVCTYPIIDDIGPGQVHCYYKEDEPRKRKYIPVMYDRFFNEPA